MLKFAIPTLVALLLAVPAQAHASAGRSAKGTRTGGKARVAQLDITTLGKRSNAAAAKLREAEKRVAALAQQMASLRATYSKQLAGVDSLKKSRASWRRDRKLREQKARSQKTAIALEKLAKTLRAQRAIVVRERKATATAVRAELAMRPSEARRRYLGTLLASAQRGLKAKPKKISMPDLELDAFADPEELLEQIALIERAESRLAKQEASLARRQTHFAHMATLRAQRDRADALGALDTNAVRRSTGRTGEGAAQGDRAAEEPADNSGAPAPSEPGGGGGFSDDVESSFEASSVVLSDVVDASTQDALRRAHRSSSPKTKADAAKRAHKQVQERLERLRASKARIRAHLRRHAK